MSEVSANLSLPFIQPSQAQKHITHNEALLLLDALVQLTVISAQTGAPPSNPEDGDRYVLPTGATGAWSGHDGEIALSSDQAWVFLPPNTGWTAWVIDAGAAVRFDGVNWVATSANLQNVPHLGINSIADGTNRLTVSSEASLLTHSGAGHQLKINKAAEGDTASLLFQSGWSGRAEMGIIGTDSFQFKVSADGATFQEAFTADPATGAVTFPNGVNGLIPDGFGTGPVVSQTYAQPQGAELVSNGLGFFGSGYNYPPTFARDAVITPDSAAAFSYAGYDSGLHQMTETIPVDPRRCYQLSCLLRQESMSGDWSGFANAERHAQTFGYLCIDADGLIIEPLHHARYKSAGVDSLTTLAAPLTPGDTQITLSNAAGWNDSEADSDALGVIIFEYRDSFGRRYDHYSRIAATGLFSTAGVNKGGDTITLNAGFPALLGNPDDSNGTWPAGTVIANSAQGATCKPIIDAAPLAQTDTWYRARGHIGGLDRSGTNSALNFAPGSVAIRLAWHPNQSNQNGGMVGYPDTGATHRMWVACASVNLAPLATMDPVSSGPGEGTHDIHFPESSITTGTIELVSTGPSLNAELI